MMAKVAIISTTLRSGEPHVNRYETLLLIRPDVTNDEFSLLENSLERMISESGGKLVSFDRWGKYKLMYQVRKNTYGVYALTRFELADATKVKALKDLLTYLRVKCTDVVMRHVCRQLADEASLSYKKPDSLDSTSESRLDPSVKTFASGLERREARTSRAPKSSEGDFEVSEVEEMSSDVEA